MRLSFEYIFIVIAFGIQPALAVNGVVIEQIGSGSAPVIQSGHDNSALITQTPPETTRPTDSSSDYQKNILANPYTSPRARAEELSTEPSPAQKEKAHEVKPLDKTSLKQVGGKSSAPLKEGHKSVVIEQTASANQAKPVQKNTENHSNANENENK